ncbi:MAG: ABC transporter ATP-binding protein [Clostridia bacterium]|nr:ABC transporter ATP-binding protein [Clostridia bacterium]
MIEAKNLVKRYGTNEALHGVSFTFEDGRIYGFLGPNGAGKSTTMNIITGCLAATEGEVSINGYDIYEDAAEAKRCIGYLPEQPPLYNDMTVCEYLRYVGEAKGLKKEALFSGIELVMSKTSLYPVKDRLIKNLSKGYKQRVGIAQAILGDPPIIILDEPTVGLDPKQIIEIRELIRELGESHTVIISSHILTEISEICDYAVIIADGTVVASDTIENLTTMFEGSVNIKLDVRCTVSQAENILSSIADIRSFNTQKKGAGVVSCDIEAPKGTELRDSLFFAFADARLPIIAMAHEEVSLEKVFLALTSNPTSVENDDVKQSEEADDADEYTPVFGASNDEEEEK